jgi:dolichyl-phosphate-mannose-protein mannosyltransferase
VGWVLIRLDMKTQRKASGSSEWLIALPFAVGLLLVTLWIGASFEVFRTARENIAWTLTEPGMEERGFRRPILYAEAFPEHISRALTPRDGARMGSYLVPREFAGAILVIWILRRVSPFTLLVLGPVASAVSGVLVGRIGRRLFKQPNGHEFQIHWLLFPPLVMNALGGPSVDTLALAVIIGMILSFLGYLRNGSRRDAMICGILLGLAGFLRYSNFLIALPFAVLLWNRRSPVRDWLPALGAALSFAAAILAFNFYAYGGPLTSGYQLGERLIRSSIAFESGSLTDLSLKAVTANLATGFIGLPMVFVPLAVGCVVAGFDFMKAEGTRRRQILAIVGPALLVPIFYGPRVLWGTFEPTLDGSLIRYLLPTFALVTPFALLVLRRFAASKKAAYLLFGSLLFGYSLTSWLAPGGLSDAHDQTKYLEGVRRVVVRHVPKDAIVVTRLLDKAIFPTRQTLTLTYLTGHVKGQQAGPFNLWDFVPAPQQFAAAMKEVRSRSIPLYLLGEFSPEVTEGYKRALDRMGLSLRLVDTIPFGEASVAIPLYEIV